MLIAKSLNHLWHKLPDERKIRLKKLYYESRGYDAIGDVTDPVYIDPCEINYFMNEDSFARTVPIFGVLGGEWDIRTREIRDRGVHRMIREHFENEVPWNETNYYKLKVKRIKSEKGIGDLDSNKQSVDKYNDYLKYIDDLYQNIAEQGYKSQKELDQKSDFINRSPSITNEIQIFIGRDGEIILSSGKHRLNIAKVLGIESVPAYVRVRHQDWQDTREMIYKGETPTTVDSSHPDLQDISSRHL